MAVQDMLDLDPYCGAAFVFRETADRTKIWCGITPALCSFTSGSRAQSSSGRWFARVMCMPHPAESGGTVQLGRSGLFLSQAIADHMHGRLAAAERLFID
ncbi:hypothetical protein [Mesorhizobium sp. 128a]